MSTSADWQDGFDLRFLQPLIEQLPNSITVMNLGSSQTSCSPSFQRKPPMADRVRLSMRYRRKASVHFWMLFLASHPSAPPDFLWESDPVADLRLNSFDTLAEWPIPTASALRNSHDNDCLVLDVESVTRAICLLEEVKSTIISKQWDEVRTFDNDRIKEEFATLHSVPGAEIRAFKTEGRLNRVSFTLPLDVDLFDADQNSERVYLNVVLRPFGLPSRFRQHKIEVPDSWFGITGNELDEALWEKDDPIIVFKGKLETRLARLKERFLVRKSIISALAVSLGTPLEYNDQNFTTVSFFVNTLDISFIVRIEFPFRFPSKRAPAHIKLESLSHLHKNKVSPHTCELAPMDKDPVEFANFVVQTLSSSKLIEKFKQMAIDPAARR